MARELNEQSNIIKSVKAAGGYARKLSHRFMIGMPDLLVALPPFAPCLVEVKDLGKVVDEFDRQLDITPKQADELRRISEPYEQYHTVYAYWRRTGMVMVHVVHRGEHRLVALPRRATRLTHAYEQNPECWVAREKGGSYDVAKLLEKEQICRVRLL